MLLCLCNAAFAQSGRKREKPTHTTRTHHTHTPHQHTHTIQLSGQTPSDSGGVKQTKSVDCRETERRGSEAVGKSGKKKKEKERQY